MDKTECLVSLSFRPLTRAKSFQSVFEAPIATLQRLLSSGSLTSTELCALFLHRISAYDTRGPCLNSITRLNPHVFDEAAASDARRAAAHSPRPLEGIPYTLKDSYKYNGMIVACGSPAFRKLVSTEDSGIAQQMRNAGAILIGTTNMPPMAAGGLQRGLYGRPESPYNLDHLTAAFASGSSTGSATSTTASFAAFGFGSETVSSGRSPASNNGLVAYTPSRGVLSCRGLWPLYVTCDVPVPHTRTVEDMLTILDVLVQPDSQVEGDFWRQQTFVTLPKTPYPATGHLALKDTNSLKGKKIAVPKMYIGKKDSNPAAVDTIVSEGVIKLWQRARGDLEALGATVIETDFPLVTNYEDSSSGHDNNVVGRPAIWNTIERSNMIAWAWDDFLVQNKDPHHKCLGDVNGDEIFPKPKDYIPDRFIEIRNAYSYPGLVKIAAERRGQSILDIDGLAPMLCTLEAQRKRDLEDWLDEHGLDAVVFPANGDVGHADCDTNPVVAEYCMQNGVKYSNGNRAIRHLGVPTVSVSMGTLEGSGMPVNLTFCGKAGSDAELLSYSYAYEQQSQRRIAPPLTPALDSDTVRVAASKSLNATNGVPSVDILSCEKRSFDDKHVVHVIGTVQPPSTLLRLYVDGQAVDDSLVSVQQDGKWELQAPYAPFAAPPANFGVDLLASKTMIVVLAGDVQSGVRGQLVLA